MSYTLCTYRRPSPRKLYLIEKRENLSAAQLGGLIAHALEDVDAFLVTDEVVGTIMSYRKDGL